MHRCSHLSFSLLYTLCEEGGKDLDLFWGGKEVVAVAGDFDERRGEEGSLLLIH